MADQREAAAEPARASTPAATPLEVEARPRISAAFASALAGAALIVGTGVAIVVVVNATAGG